MNLAELLEIPSTIIPDFEGVVFEGVRHTFGEMRDRVLRLAGSLSRLGLKQGQRICILQTNSHQYLEVIFACARLGLVAVPLNYRVKKSELDHLMREARPSACFVGERYLDLMRSVCDRTICLITFDQPQPGLYCHEHLVREGERREALAEVAESDPGLILFTSGTTACPKAVVFSHVQLGNYVFAHADPPNPERATEATLLSAPLYHVAGLTAVMTNCFSGRRLVILSQFEPASWLGLAESEEVTHAFVVPTMMRQLLDHPQFDKTNLAKLKLLSYGAAPMPLSIIREAIRRFPHSTSFVSAYGQTETTSTITMLGPEDHRFDESGPEGHARLRRLASVGRPLPDVEIAILGDDGNRMAAGGTGEVAVRSHRLASGYAKEDYLQPASEGGWLLTGDLGWLDEEGYLYLVGRKRDLIIRAGENISPDEVEDVLRQCHGVEDAAVVGLPSEQWGQRVAAAVVCSPGTSITLEELHGFCRRHLSTYKVPEEIRVVSSLPQNSMGKTLRREVLKAFIDGSADERGSQ